MTNHIDELDDNIKKTEDELDEDTKEAEDKFKIKIKLPNLAKSRISRGTNLA